MSFPPYAEYKDSGVAWLGMVPGHWTVKRLRELIQLINGYPFDAAKFGVDEGMPLVRIRDLNASEAAVRFDGEPVEMAVITSDDLLIGMDGDFNVGRWYGHEPALLNQRVCCLRGDTQILRLLEYTLPVPLQQINDLTYSTTVKHLSSGQVLDIRVILPEDPSELTGLVGFLDREVGKIDGLVAEQERLIALLKEKRQAVISHAVTKGLNPNAPLKDSGIEWLGQIPQHWEVVPLKRIADPQTSITYGIVQAGPDTPDGVPYIRTSDMSGDELPVDGYMRTTPEIDAAYARSKVAAGDLVIAIRATIGKPLIVPAHLAGANLTQGTAKFSPGADVLARYVQLVLGGVGATGEFERIAKGSTFKEITLDMLRRFAIPVPPLNEQQQICDWIDGPVAEFGELLLAAADARTLLQERRAALISAAVTGKIDVRAAANAAPSGAAEMETA